VNVRVLSCSQLLLRETLSQRGRKCVQKLSRVVADSWSHLGAGDKGTLDLGCADAVTRGVDDIVHSAGDPVVSVGVAATSITSEVVT
jgi:hypothetical protein